MRFADAPVLALVAFLGCVAGCEGGASKATAAVPAATVNAVAPAVERLRDPDPAVRDKAAAELRAAPPDRSSEARWRQKLSAVHPGMARAEVERILGGPDSEGVGGPGGSTSTYRLDDHWIVVAERDGAGTLKSLQSPTQSERAVWVEPPPGFRGRWSTYFVNGVVARVAEYVDGKVRELRVYYDNAQLMYAQRYVGGDIDGPEAGYYRDGRKSYEGNHAAGKNVGRWVHWYPDGHMQSVEKYVDGVLDGASIGWREDGTKRYRIDYRAGLETGQAAWDERAKLIFARGTTEQDPDRE